jgi:predicted kinase
MSQVLFIVRGIPASGKSRFSVRWVSEDPLNRARVNRDDLRFATFGSYVLSHELEGVITKMEHALISTLLASGKSVIVDNMNLRAKYLKPYLELAKRAGVQVLHKDFPVEYDVALQRNAARDRQVPESVMKRIYDSFIRKGSFPKFPVLEEMETFFEPYTADVNKQSAYIFDIDGTLALMVDRGPFEWAKVLNDLPNEPVIHMAKLLDALGHKIIITSGRDAICREDTEIWLHDQGVEYEALYMRPEGSGDKDTIVKLAIFNEHIRENYYIRGVFDDRLMVAKLWHEMGLPLFRVGDPEANF